MKRKVAIYARVSTEHEAQINALGNQIQYYDNLIACHPEWEVYKKYIDEGITGTSLKKRGQFLAMLKDAKVGKFDLIVTREVSRFARNTVDTLQQTRTLKKYGVEVYFTEDNIWTMNDEDGELRLTLMATLAQNESKKLSVRVKAGQKISFENGVLYGNGNVLGYSRVGSELVINPEQAETVKMIFDLYLEGYGCTKIARLLEQRGRLTSMGRDRWYPGTVSRVLRNSFYCGRIVYRKQFVADYLEQKKINNFGEVPKIEVKGSHEPIVSEELFDKVQSKIDENSITKNRGRHALRRPKNIYSKKLICECGSTFERRVWHRYEDGRCQHGYQCYKQINIGSYRTRLKKGLDVSDSCRTRMFQEWKIHMMAFFIFGELWDDRKSIINKAIALIDEANNKKREVDNGSEIDRLIAEKEKLNKKLDNLVEVYLEGDLNKEMYTKKKVHIQKQLDYCDTCLTELKSMNMRSEPDIYKRKTLEQLLKVEIEKLKDTIPEELIEALVDKIIVHEDYFEWRLKISHESLKCKVNGRKDKATVESLDNYSNNSELQHRQLLHKRGTRTKPTEKPLEIGTFVIGKEYLNEYKKYDPNMKKVNKWKDIVLKITV